MVSGVGIIETVFSFEDSSKNAIAPAPFAYCQHAHMRTASQVWRKRQQHPLSMTIGNRHRYTKG